MTEPSPAAFTNVHATGLVLDGIGLLLRGPSGAGKSLLALQLLDRAALAGTVGLLVADDRVDLEPVEGGLRMHAPKTIAGLIELRGRGIVRRPSLTQAPLHLVVDLCDTLVRMVEEEELVTELIGVRLPRCPVPRRGVVDSAHQMLLIGEALAELKPAHRKSKENTT